MEHQEGQAERFRQLNFLHQGFDGFVAILRGRCAEVDQVTGMSKDGGQLARGQFVGVAAQVLRGVRLAEPLEVALHEYLTHMTHNPLAPNQSHMNTTSSRTMCAKKHAIKLPFIL